jgi:hypothetical protein
MDYITCETRKNEPKINVLICEKKCQHVKTCKSYLNYLKVQSATAAITDSPLEEEDILSIKESPQKTPPLTVGK